MPAKYSVVQYVPNVVADERLNIGVVVWDRKQIHCRFIDNWRRAKSFGGEDVGFLKDFARWMSDAADGQTSFEGIAGHSGLDVPQLEKMVGRWGHSIQFTEPRGSTKEAHSLAKELPPLFLTRPSKQRPKRRDRRFAVKMVSMSLLEAIEKKAPHHGKDWIKRRYTIDGAVEPHEFDLVLKNGVELAAVDAISFEINVGEHLQKDVLSTKWGVCDVRNRCPNLPLGVFMLPPKTKQQKSLYDETVNTIRALKADVLTEQDIKRWAQDRAKAISP